MVTAETNNTYTNKYISNNNGNSRKNNTDNNKYNSNNNGNSRNK